MPSRTGFSLIELLVVITILTILISSIAVYIGPMGAQARRASTLTTLTKLESLLNSRLVELQQNFQEQESKKLVKDEWVNLQFNSGFTAGVYGGQQAPVRTALVKLDRYRGSFPQRLEDLYGLDNADAPYTPGGERVNPILELWNSTKPVWNNVARDSSAHQADTTNAELLYLIIYSAASNGANDTFLDSINIRHLRDSDNDGIPEFYDDWGNMLRFYNAPTRLIRPGGAGSAVTTTQYAMAKSFIGSLPPVPASATDYTQAFNQDPMDPKGAVRALSDVVMIENTFHTPTTWYRPLIVSAGADGDFGMGDPTTAGADRLGRVTSEDAAADNVTNLQTAGGP